MALNNAAVCGKHRESAHAHSQFASIRLENSTAVAAVKQCLNKKWNELNWSWVNIVQHIDLSTTKNIFLKTYAAHINY